MRRLFKALAYAVVGYGAGALAGYAGVQLLSTNMHDRAVEAAMTGAFVTGPLVALLASVLGATLSMCRRDPRRQTDVS